MIMDNRFLVARRRYDPDATRYINAVQLADGQALEPEVAMAVDAFVRGCKADGIWDAIKASCIMCGARTISGALVPLAGTAPTPYNFVAADYDRSGGGLKGDGSTKYLDSNRANNADGQDDNHNAVYISQVATGVVMASQPYNNSGRNYIALNTLTVAVLASRSNSSIAIELGALSAGLYGTTRSSPTAMTARTSLGNTAYSHASQTPESGSVTLFARSDGTTASSFSDARLAFYSIGSAIPDLAALDNRVSTLVSAIAAAL